MERTLIFSVLVVALSLSSLGAHCPPEEDIAPCTCRESIDGGMLTCSKIFSPIDLLNPIRATRGYKMYALLIMDSTLNYLEHDTFEGTNYQKIRLLDSQLLSLSDTDVAFEGLEDTLTEIRATGASYVTHWQWTQLSNIKNLDLIDINHIQLDSVEEDFPPFVKLTALGLINASISYMSDNAFAALTALRIWDMRDNEITELKRSMLPNPAQHLFIINFVKNKLQNLPSDFFTEMPALIEVRLEDNQFMVFDENVFKNVLGKIQLYVNGNPFNCDCRMTWILDRALPYDFDGHCSQPASLKGKAIRHLQRRELFCF